MEALPDLFQAQTKRLGFNSIQTFIKYHGQWLFIMVLMLSMTGVKQALKQLEYPL
jgi:hypothetical protein